MTPRGFKDIPIAPSRYAISEKGEVYDKVKKRIIKNTPSDRGYLKTSLVIDGKRYFFYLHRLLALTYLPNKDKLPMVNHKTGDKASLGLKDLEWSAFSDNNYHASSTGLSNSSLRKDSSSGVTGVTKRGNRYLPYINIRKKRYYGSMADNLDDAEKNRIALKRALYSVKAAYIPMGNYMKAARNTLDITDELAGKVDDYRELRGNKQEQPKISAKNMLTEKLRKKMNRPKVPKIKKVELTVKNKQDM